MSKEVFNALDEVIYKHLGKISGADFFRLVSEYQLTRLNEVEKFQRTQQEQALYRTAMYDTELLNSYKKTTSSKKKEALVFKLVNLLCIANNSIKAIEMASEHDKEIFYIILSYKNKILSNKEWYLRVIPESNWLIEYMEKSQDETR